MAIPDDIRTTRDELIDLAPDYDVDVRAYSGRGMYGAKCLGLVGDPDDLWRLTQTAAVESRQTMEPPRRDSMGRSDEVWYWTGEAPPAFDERLPDTAESAVAEFRRLTTTDAGNHVGDDYSTEPDPHHPGVWKVETPEIIAVVYLGGYEGRTETDIETTRPHG